MKRIGSELMRATEERLLRRSALSITVSLALAACATIGEARADTDVWNNTAKHARSDDALNADVAACEQRFGELMNGTATSSGFKRCMLQRGWRYGGSRRTPEDTWIDPETGLTCRHSTFLGVPSSECSNV
jgi:hypothetical protein